jgi:uncharacterized membrane protein
MVDESTAVGLVLAMAMVTYLSRIAGVWAMSFVSTTPRIAATLKALSGSVLVALVVPAAVAGGPVYIVAVVIAAMLTVITGRPLAAMVSGVAAAAILRAWIAPM